MHGGRIPEYRGASVLQWAIINGERTLGVTWHQIVEEVDAGPIWAETEIPIHSDDMASTVRERMISAGHELFHSAWSALTEGALPVRVPDLSKGRIWPQRKDADGLVPPGLPEKRVRDLVRALSPPWPGASIMAPSGLRRIERLGGPEDENALRYETADGRILFLCLSDHP
jgi:methionyl-tRNA formyltransferase